MRNARLVSLEIKNFKSFESSGEIELSPLTIVIGRNNSGKSSLIQSILLLKQTLAAPRPDVMLKLEGMVDAFNLRELTFGWPAAAEEVPGPEISIGWECLVNKTEALTGSPDLENLAKHSKVSWLNTPTNEKNLRTTIKICTAEIHGSAQITKVLLTSYDDKNTTLEILLENNKWVCLWNGKAAPKLEVEFDNFLPILNIDRSSVGRRSAERAYHNAYLVLFAQPLDALKAILADFHYLGSSRIPAPSLFKPATSDPNEIGVSGEYAAQLLHRKRKDIVHYLPVGALTNGSTCDQVVVAAPLEEAVNSTMNALSINAPLNIKDIENVGFQLMFGSASLGHVGRGLGQLLPLVELGLFADPLRFKGEQQNLPLEEYLRTCPGHGHIALEEPEAHLHPKVASLLAHWLVSLAQSKRRIIVETHSDHLVRRLRGLVARAGRSSPLETWLLENVVILSIEQNASGKSSISSSKLTSDGSMSEVWPADFMDEASDEESAIYFAQLDKNAPAREVKSSKTSDIFIPGDEPESDIEP
ncbi:AAA family ATPase [Pseudomonas sp. L-22-4S-12]|uniref:AAA family ATPase n=1 Tax=Pseudomonas sp. L-22-4S-12 TaxID=2610893 RepID=UPI00132530D6|nr:AAA family ATPase [Pseudomonas sp. L-22-4S-12]MWV15202.1 AAA family ATPase [Pseudomonas sp. L-22-4S-12]